MAGVAQSQPAFLPTADPTEGTTASSTSGTSDANLNWTPPAMAQLSAEALSRTIFSLDRNTLGMAAALVLDPEPETRHAIAKLDGLSVQLLRFGAAGIPDEAQVNQVRRDYELHGWKHVVSSKPGLRAGAGDAGLVHEGITDLWVAMDGMNVRQAAALVESRSTVTLLTFSGNISPVDLLHLRGHFGIPRFDAGDFKAGEAQ